MKYVIDKLLTNYFHQCFHFIPCYRLGLDYLQLFHVKTFNALTLESDPTLVSKSFCVRYLIDEVHNFWILDLLLEEWQHVIRIWCLKFEP